MYLIIGCGYVGSRVAALLQANGQPFTAVTHSTESASRLQEQYGFTVYACDVGNADSVKSLAASLPSVPTHILHCASSNRGGADAYRHVFVQGCTHLITNFPSARLYLTSSSSVYPQTDGSWVTEESPATPDRETSQLLREAEELVLAQQGCVARLAGIYGPERSFVLKQFLEGTATIEGYDHEGRWLNQIHHEDAAHALIHLMSRNAQGIYNVADADPLSQRDCFTYLCSRYQRPLPPHALPNPNRKRAWTHKRVSSVKLRDSGFSFLYPSYTAALENDPELEPSILSQIHANVLTQPTVMNPEASHVTEPDFSQRARNVVLVGLMGSGKTTVGKLVAHNLGFGFVDTDQLIIDEAGCSVPDIFANEGEQGFRLRESNALRKLAESEGQVIATGGGIVTQPQNMPLLKQLGYVIWLFAAPKVLHGRTAHNHDRPLLRNDDPEGTLNRLLADRGSLYEQACDLKVSTDDLNAQDVAYGVAESVRVAFSKCQT